MSIEDITGFENYTSEIINQLRHKFGAGETESRPYNFNNVIIWVDGEGRMHRPNGPAVERANGTKEYWIHGVKKHD